jgi:hypothetical protein
MDASDGGGRDARRLPARSAARLGGNVPLQQIRTRGANAAALRSTARPTTRQIAAAFVRLCQQPTRDLSAWAGLDDRPGRAAIPGAFRQTAKQKTASRRPGATAGPSGSGRGAAAYAAELANWQPLIDAAATDPSLSREQRAGAVGALRVRQQIAAAAARQRVTEEERQTAKAQRRIARQQLRRFNPPDLTP